MTKPKLTYFDASASRGEECRLALHLAGVDFEDVRIKFGDWPELKPKTPYGGIPIFELPGHPVLAQTNAILVLIGRRHGLHPKDDVEAAQHEAMMCHVDDLRTLLGQTLRMDEALKRRIREDLSASYIPEWGARVENQLGDGPFFAGPRIHVVDLRLYMVVTWLSSGMLDHVPQGILSDFPRLNRVHEAVRDHEGVKAWYARPH